MKENLKKYKKALFLLILGALLLTGTGTVKAHAAVSRTKAIRMYNNAITVWGRKNSKTRIIDSIHDSAGAWSKCYKIGKLVSIRPLYIGQPRYIFRDLNGDGTIEALFQTGNYLYVFTIYGGRVKCLGAICVEDNTELPIIVYYNKKAKTFSIRQNITVRMTTVKSYQIRNGRLQRRNTLSRYVGPMDHNYRIQYEYFVNGRRCSNAYYRRCYKAYLGSVVRYGWAP